MRRYEHGGDIYTNSNVMLDFSVNTNPLGMPAEALDAISKQLRDFTRYPDPACRALRAALSERHQVPAEQILCGNGASDLLFRICAALRPKLALTLAPTFSEYARSVLLFGGEMREHRLSSGNGFIADEGILPALTPETDMLFLCDPNNPTGRLCAPELIARILKRCEKNGTLLVLDECFIDFTDGGSRIAQLCDHPNLLILRAFTKFYSMAGLRLGYLMCSDTSLLSRIEAFGATWSVSGVAQAAGVAALSSRDWEAETLGLVKRERAYLTAQLKKLGLTVYESDANFLLVKGERPLYEPLIGKGILVRRCENFSGLDETYFRIGVKTHEHNEALISALSETLNG